ncbi:hypothetical protein M431DRAFT_239101 [Trichoderma harzianum CBS 226.95]|uniref:Uncharacterized protein n=1 Tax=Trichoderma harzianum CBS 226.95 TaxID=983964 RepID=A0A2T4A2K1_TRIHA|nr:hypothetical protein M431DRAFT_239101 [Trichoderma harzianum CBS 226.95]PTB51290.1 hypothetical protein M431DRAFT_239101 [Trichoderma harzianum CBS 226.95]
MKNATFKILGSLLVVSKFVSVILLSQQLTLNSMGNPFLSNEAHSESEGSYIKTFYEEVKELKYMSGGHGKLLPGPQAQMDKLDL